MHHIDNDIPPLTDYSMYSHLLSSTRPVAVKLHYINIIKKLIFLKYFVIRLIV